MNTALPGRVAHLTTLTATIPDAPNWGRVTAADHRVGN
jgi:hypothetical protein